MSGVDDDSWHERTAEEIARLSGFDCASEVASALASEGSYLRAADRDDLAQWVLLEIIEFRAAAKPIDLPELKRMIHRIRQRVYRQSHRAYATDREVLSRIAVDPPLPSLESPLAGLGDDEMLIVSLRVDGMSPATIAKTLGISVATLYRRFDRIRNAIVR